MSDDPNYEAEFNQYSMEMREYRLNELQEYWDKNQPKWEDLPHNEWLDETIRCIKTAYLLGYEWGMWAHLPKLADARGISMDEAGGLIRDFVPDGRYECVFRRLYGVAIPRIVDKDPNIARYAYIFGVDEGTAQIDELINIWRERNDTGLRIRQHKEDTEDPGDPEGAVSVP